MRSINIALLAEDGDCLDTRSINIPSWRRASTNCAGGTLFEKASRVF